MALMQLAYQGVDAKVIQADRKEEITHQLMKKAENKQLMADTQGK